MSGDADVILTSGDDALNDDLRCVVDIRNPELVGHPALLVILARTEVKDKRPVHKEKRLYQQRFTVAAQQTFTIPRTKIQAYTYRGEHIDQEIHVSIEVDDGLLFDTRIASEQALRLGFKAPVADNAQALVEPADAFQFFANLQAIDSGRRLLVLALALVGGAIMVANALVGVHDQFAVEGATWLYSHYDSDGDAQLPLLNSLAASGALGAAVWAAMRHQLRQYMTFRLKRLPPRITPDTRLQINALVAGRGRTALEDVTLRVVAANMEKGQYTRGSGTNQRTVSFSEPVRAVVLYEQRVARIAAHVPIDRAFTGAVEFAPMFSALYPPLRIGSTHGLDVYWEVQLLHPTFVDQELVASTAGFRYEDFLRA